MGRDGPRRDERAGVGPRAPLSCHHGTPEVPRHRLGTRDNEHDARERSTAKLDAPSASQALGCCKHESSSRAAGVALPLSDNLGIGAAAQHGPSGLGAVAGAASATSAAASSPPRKRAPRRPPGRPRPGRGMSPFALAGPAMPDGTKRLKDTLGLTVGRVSGVPPRGLKMCLAQAGSAPMARPQESRWSTGSTR
jgi:hypothetical protein